MDAFLSFTSSRTFFQNGMPMKNTIFLVKEKQRHSWLKLRTQ